MIKCSNRIITINRTPVYFGKDVFPEIDRLVHTLHPDGLFILGDTNTRKHCLPLLMEQADSLASATVMEIDGGEAAKTLENAEKLWHEMLENGAVRNSLLINLGGGVVSDLGGFVAAGYKRGIRYINVPTSLMGQADAAIGGKTAVNLGNLKNQVGFFHAAEGVFISPEFLNTLPEVHMRSGLAEIIKSTLISNGKLWRRLQKTPVSAMLTIPAESGFWQELILAAVTYKNKVVAKDYREKRLRKVLNFGHTFGHAFESFSIQNPGLPMLHGEAVAAGMICAAYLSFQKTGLSQDDMQSIEAYLRQGFGLFPVDPSSKARLMEMMMHDKKVLDGRLHFTLISNPGAPVLNVKCNPGEVSETIDYYHRLSE
jgi:3-dehydroquinate synthase